MKNIFSIFKKKPEQAKEPIVKKNQPSPEELAEKARIKEEEDAKKIKRIKAQTLYEEEHKKIAQFIVENFQPIKTFSISKIGQENKYHTYYDMDDSDLLGQVIIEKQTQEHEDDFLKEKGANVVFVNGTECGEVSDRLYESIEELTNPKYMVAYVTEVGIDDGLKTTAKVAVFEHGFIRSYVAGLNYNNEDGTSRSKIAKEIFVNSVLNPIVTKYENEDAIELWHDNKQIGYVPKDDLKATLRHIKDKTLRSISVMSNNEKDGKLYMDIEIKYMKS